MSFLPPDWREALRSRWNWFLTRWQSILLRAALVFVGAVIVAAGYGYLKFKPMLDERLQRQPHTDAVYFRPFTVRVGQTLSMKSLLQEIGASGYETTPSRYQPDWYEAVPGEVRLHRGAEETQDTISIQLKAGRVASLSEGNQSLEQVALKPEFLSNLMAKGREKRKYVRYQQIPPRLVQAVLAAEDADFFRHNGLDLKSLGRATFNNLFGLRSRADWQGGSTITQQFVKNYFLTPEKSFARKLEEAYLSLLVEARFTKGEIFEFYANEVYLGQVGGFGMIGLAEAADGYFGKELPELTTAECALLAGMIQAPNRFSPLVNREAAQRRRNHVIAMMQRRGVIAAEEARAASLEPVRTVSSTNRLYTEAPYFVDYLSSAVKQQIPEWQKTERLDIFSSLDPDLQRVAAEAVRQGMARVEKRRPRSKAGDPPQAALIAVDPRTGDILAMIGGRNYRRSQFNRATQAYRQPGSAFKPFVYAAALSSGRYSLGSIVVDEPYRVTFGDKEYEPSNFGGEYRGSVTLRRALALSLNVPTVKIAEKVGYQSVASFSKRMGFSEDLQAFPSLALGTWEVTLLDMAQAYTAFANSGRGTRLRPMAAYSINGRMHQVPVQSQEVISPRVAYLITSALESAVTWGTAAGVRSQGFGLPAAGKTGSSNDSWFVGYTPDMLCIVWVGNDDFTDIHLVGADAALPIWTDFMKRAAALGRLSGARFQPPTGLAMREIDTDTGLLANLDCPHVQWEYFIPGTEPIEYCYSNHEFDVFDEEDRPSPPEETSAPREEKKGGLWRILRIFH